MTRTQLIRYSASRLGMENWGCKEAVAGENHVGVMAAAEAERPLPSSVFGGDAGGTALGSPCVPDCTVAPKDDPSNPQDLCLDVASYSKIGP